MNWRIAVLALIVPLLGLAGYSAYVYQGLDESFVRRSEFKPTKIYSDVTALSLAQQRKGIQSRLRSLGYKPEIDSPQAISFILHKTEYPGYLIPENHPQAQFADQKISLQFDGPGPDDSLQTIHIGETEVSDVFLEPELVATLSRGASEFRNDLQFSEIPSQLWQAIIAVEDQHFLDHRGFDPRGIARALWINLKTLRYAQGGSTLTQQLVKNLTGHKRRSIFRKINELILALLLEIKYDKEKILERYLNEVNLGQVGNIEINGVSEGARYFFGKPVSSLTLAECAFMMGIARGTDYYSPHRHFDRAIARQKIVLQRMVEANYIAPEELNLALKQKILIAPPPPAGSKAPYFTDYVKSELVSILKSKFSEEEIEAADLRIYTTLDLSLNSIAQASVTQTIQRLESKQTKTATARLEGAMAVVEQKSGFIRALIGGRDYGASNFNRILNMKRQVGSTFKPFVFLAAFEKGYAPNGTPWGAGTPIEDSPWKLIYDHGQQNWQPRNYEKSFMGWITFRQALAHSVNTATAKLASEVGLKNIIQTARNLGIQSPLPEVPSLSLGVAELNPLELLTAYATLANHGSKMKLTTVRAVTSADGTTLQRVLNFEEPAVDAGAADLVSSTLQSVFTEGTARGARSLGFDRPAAGKTGTTSNHRDAWFAGYTPQLTAVAWVGADQDGGGAPLALTGATSALPIWTQFMNQALSSEPLIPFSPSPKLTQVRLDARSGFLATLDCSERLTLSELTIVGKEPTEMKCSQDWPKSTQSTELRE